MASIKNKAELSDRYKAGKPNNSKKANRWYKFGVSPETKQPLDFANSNQLAKLKRKK